MHIRRRSFIKCASLAAAGNFAGLRAFSNLSALAQATQDYKALVCVFLFGGNDANNLIVPVDITGYANYQRIRAGLALPQNSLLPLSSLPNFALHDSMRGVQTLFNSGSAAFVANVGTLAQPTTREQYLSGSQVPANLFSHPDQQQEWQNASQSASIRSGWAGRMSDVMSATWNPSGNLPMITSVAGNTLFGNGVTTTPVSVIPGDLSIGDCSEGAACGDRLAAAQSLITLSSGVSLVNEDNAVTGDAYRYGSTLIEATQALGPLKTPFPNDSLGKQLQQVAQIIQARSAFNVHRQIFFVSLGNFDTHSDQLPLQENLLSTLDSAVSAFYAATQEMGVANGVTTFTMSDFARTLQPNSNSGSDHAWGSHHFVLGGAVKGGVMYGKFPELALSGADDSGDNGRWVPTTASVQYAATLAQWFGLPESQLSAVFPNINNFAVKKLEFL